MTFFFAKGTRSPIFISITCKMELVFENSAERWFRFQKLPRSNCGQRIIIFKGIKKKKNPYPTRDQKTD